MPEHVQGASSNSPLLLEWWKPIVGYEGYYEVSCVGNIRRVGKTKSLSPGFNRKGYASIHLHREGVKFAATVHGIVAAHFIGPRPQGLIVNHINGVKSINRVSNLEYLTPLENTRHAMETGLYKPGSYQRKLSDDDILEIRGLLAAGLYTTEIAKRFDIHSSAISRIQSGKLFATVGEVQTVIPNRGSRHKMAKVSEADVLAIRELRGKATLREIALMYGISMSNVSDIQRRKIWNHVA